jgi:hypothetical protein
MAEPISTVHRSSSGARIWCGFVTDAHGPNGERPGCVRSAEFCAECGCWKDLRTAGCDACKHRVQYLERSIVDPDGHRSRLDAKNAWRRQERAAGRLNRLGRRTA